MFILLFFLPVQSNKGQDLQDAQDRKRQDEQDRFIYPADHAGASPIMFILLFFCQYRMFRISEHDLSIFGLFHILSGQKGVFLCIKHGSWV
ncbi:MAG: hypothetical protein KGI83_02790 [Verrucomicrobiota bacterium]|nr:hypothetical protein [Verrucomicrobiota bacterium]